MQRLLEYNSPDEHILRIDSIAEYKTTTTIYYVTDKGTRQFKHKNIFRSLIIKGYKANGKDDCFVTVSKNAASVTKCYDSACTIIIDTDYIARKTKLMKLKKTITIAIAV